MPISGVRLGGGPEYQLPSQETLVLAKAAAMASVSCPLTMMPRFAAFPELVAAGASAEEAAPPSSLGAVTGVAAAVTVEELLEVGAATGTTATVAEVSATAGVDVLELGSPPIAASVVAELAAGKGVIELVFVKAEVMRSIGEEVPASVGTGA